MFDWFKSRFQIQRVEMDRDLLVIMEYWHKLTRQQRDRVKLLVIQGARTSQTSLSSDDQGGDTNSVKPSSH